ncbi:hypothetical protein [Rhodococcus sp. NCIMB 12038]|uniref:hypothetical protein n=1 Tax=Rhodococcus sp. NCIMB 12038 TaxID=933800 RepID=UPI00211B522E|nr:hypothetical protein [Rhodococcus sp. NCIMB 12038]
MDVLLVARTGPRAEQAGVRTGVVITAVEGKDTPAFADAAAATRSLSGPVDLTIERHGQQQTIVVVHSALCAVPASIAFTGDVFAMTGWDGTRGHHIDVAHGMFHVEPPGERAGAGKSAPLALSPRRR